MATKLEGFGLKPEEHMRSCEQGFALTKTAIIAFKNDGYPNWRDFGKGVESIEEIGIPRSPFWHHLSDIKEIDGEHMMNIWAVASLFISAAHGWVPDEGKSEQGKKIIFEVLPTVAPTVDIERLMFRSRYDDRALLKLCSLVMRAIEQKCDKSFNL